MKGVEEVRVSQEERRGSWEVKEKGGEEMTKKGPPLSGGSSLCEAHRQFYQGCSSAVFLLPVDTLVYSLQLQLQRELHSQLRHLLQLSITMADVEMKDSAGSSKGKAVAKGSDSDKKKFEVKKVSPKSSLKLKLQL